MLQNQRKIDPSCPCVGCTNSINKASEDAPKIIISRDKAEVADFLKKFGIHSIRLNSHCKAWCYKKKKHKNIKAYRKSVKKEPTVKRFLLILDLKPFRS